MSNVIFQWPLLLAVLHNGGAAALLVALVVLNYRAWQVRTRAVGASEQAAATQATG